jgi:peroxiredoxin
MHRISKKYAGRNVTCFGVHCDPTVTAATASTHARKYGLRFPILLDPTQQLARDSGVRVTPEAVLVSPAGNVLYRGRIDDRYAVDGKRRDTPQSLDLERALDAVLAGGQPPVSETKAFGCPLPRSKAASK